ncbi:MAG TPA: hypothetical protein PLD41_04805 [Casimicrobium huifangae]|uniref:hypothetical protein n=1 Tax=Casimicrobium huifangae TaxID=2591109 RepID=UPI001EE238FB|nr:hypothetical protein [Casimicrobium huifangae]HOB02146.1 hypothetical protein [Casimicrobium huifangae]HQA33123.1 hypothetical protein [Casimicrobium huifangae]
MTNHAGGARTIDHREWLREMFLRGFGKCTGQHVGATAGTRRHHDFDRSVGVCRLRKWHAERKRAARGREQLAATPIDGGLHVRLLLVDGNLHHNEAVATGKVVGSIASVNKLAAG